MARSMILDSRDNVSTLLEKSSKGEEIIILSPSKEEIKRIKSVEDIPQGHKISVVDIEEGSEIRKFGENIGRASDEIKEGSHVHIHNVESNIGKTRSDD